LPPILAAPTGQLPEAFGDLIRVEAQARPASRSEPLSTQLVGVVIDPAPPHPPKAGDLLGGYRLRARGRLLRRHQLDQAACQRLDRFGVEAQFAAQPDRLATAHRGLPKGARRTFGF
jgi:hypothetical protein